MDSLAERFAHVREAMGWSKAEMSRAIGISRSAVGQIELGDTKTLKGTTVTALERATGFSGLWLTSGKGPERKLSGALTGPEGDQIDKIYAALVRLPQSHRDKIEAEIDFLLSVSGNQE